MCISDGFDDDDEDALIILAASVLRRASASGSGGLTFLVALEHPTGFDLERPVEAHFTLRSTSVLPSVEAAAQCCCCCEQAAAAANDKPRQQQQQQQQNISSNCSGRQAVRQQQHPTGGTTSTIVRSRVRSFCGNVMKSLENSPRSTTALAGSNRVPSIQVGIGARPGGVLSF